MARKALIIEDARATAAVGRHALEAAGYEVTIAANFEQLRIAADRFKGEELDAIFLDMLFPEKRKIDLFDWVHANIDGPITVVTSLSDPDFADQIGRKDGLVGYFSKHAGRIPWAQLAEDGQKFARRFSILM